MNNKKAKLKKKFLLFMFIYFVFFTLSLSLMTLSKFHTTVSNNSEEIAIAKWEVSLDESESSDTLNIVNGNATQNYIVKLTSNSDVGAYYSIILTNVPNNVRVSLDGGTATAPTSNSIAFEDVGLINVTDTQKTKQHTLTFSASVGSGSINNNQIGIDVIFRQAETN